MTASAYKNAYVFILGNETLESLVIEGLLYRYRELGNHNIKYCFAIESPFDDTKSKIERTGWLRHSVYSPVGEIDKRQFINVLWVLVNINKFRSMFFGPKFKPGNVTVVSSKKKGHFWKASILGQVNSILPPKNMKIPIVKSRGNLVSKEDLKNPVFLEQGRLWDMRAIAAWAKAPVETMNTLKKGRRSFSGNTSFIGINYDEIVELGQVLLREGMVFLR